MTSHPLLSEDIIEAAWAGAQAETCFIEDWHRGTMYAALLAALPMIGERLAREIEPDETVAGLGSVWGGRIDATCRDAAARIRLLTAKDGK